MRQADVLKSPSKVELKTIERLSLREKNLHSLCTLQGCRNQNKMEDIERKWTHYTKDFDISEIGLKIFQGRTTELPEEIRDHKIYDKEEVNLNEIWREKLPCSHV